MKGLRGLSCVCLAMMMLAGCAASSFGTSSSSASSSADETAETDTTTQESVKVLVAYFSATGTTKKLATTIADVTGGTLYEITPADPYTEADLDYNDDDSRTTLEQNDVFSRPELSGSVEDFDDYDVIYLGYPIWWYDAPHIMFTFAESYDFSGKTIIPFCTSGGSGIGNSGDNLEACANGGTWLEGARMDGDASASEVSEWIESLGL